MGVRTSSSREVVVPDDLADPRPRHPAEMKQRYTAVAKVMRTEQGNSGSRAAPCHRGAKAVRSHEVEYPTMRMPVFPGNQIEHTLK